MKKNKELDVDFLGGQGPLTKEEEQALNDFFKIEKTKKRITRFSKSNANLSTQKRASL